MNFFEFPGVKMSALAAAVPDHEQNLMDLAANYPEGEVQRLCETTGCWKRFISAGVGTTSSDLCVAAAKEIFEKMQIDKSTIDGLIFLTQTPDYIAPPTSCVIQYRLGLDHCGLVYDSNLGCAAFPYGIQLACAQIMSGCKRVLLLIGDSRPGNGCKGEVPKGSLFFGDCGIAIILEKANTMETMHMELDTIGKGYKALILPYGQHRHPLYRIGQERNLSDCALPKRTDTKIRKKPNGNAKLKQQKRSGLQSCPETARPKRNEGADDYKKPQCIQKYYFEPESGWRSAVNVQARISNS